jgi:hypothetical protein
MLWRTAKRRLSTDRDATLRTIRAQAIGSRPGISRLEKIALRSPKDLTLLELF